MGTVSGLPIWKKDATPAERFYELHLLALSAPEQFAKYIVIYEEDAATGKTKTRQVSNVTNLAERVGIMHFAIKGVE